MSFAVHAAKSMMDWSGAAYEAEHLAKEGYDESAFYVAVAAKRHLEDAAIATLVWLLDEFEEDEDESPF